jgi:hypothetical protein
MCFAFISDVSAVSILPVGDIRDDLSASVRKLNAVLSLNRVSVTGLMSVVVITRCVVPYSISESVGLRLEHESNVQVYREEQLAQLGLKRGWKLQKKVSDELV